VQEVVEYVNCQVEVIELGTQCNCHVEILSYFCSIFHILKIE
jgi:hypothetical protein